MRKVKRPWHTANKFHRTEVTRCGRFGYATHMSKAQMCQRLLKDYDTRRRMKEFNKEYRPYVMAFRREGDGRTSHTSLWLFLRERLGAARWALRDKF